MSSTAKASFIRQISTRRCRSRSPEPPSHLVVADLMPEAPRTEVRGEGVDLAGHLALAGEAARSEHEFPLVDLDPPELADQRPVQPGPRVRRVLREAGLEEPLDLRPMPAAQRQETRISLERPGPAPHE